MTSKRILETAKNSLATPPDAARFSAHDAARAEGVSRYWPRRPTRQQFARWPAARITLRQGIRVLHDTGQQLAH